LLVLVSTHPRTRKKLENISKEKLNGILFHEPFGFFDYNHLQLNARAVLSDSGTVSEESIILGFPALTIRESMERPEALEAGSIVMCGIEATEVLKAIEYLEASEKSKVPPMEYQFPDTSTRVANVLISTVHRQGFWNGLRKI
jgi:UDP-N-acetylglucosamine 2-epimerase (non-hydrolysing)